jgi:Zn-dependent protease
MSMERNQRSFVITPPPAGKPPGTIQIGSLLGFRVHMHWSWLLLLGLATWSLAIQYLPAQNPGWSDRQLWTAGAGTALLLFLCVLAHELARALVTRRRGYPLTDLTLVIFGGSASIPRESRTARDELWIAAAGPLVSLALAAVAVGVWVGAGALDAGSVAGIALILALVNAMIGGFNLLPAFPLDGGRVLRAVLWGRGMSLLRATRAASITGKVIAALLIGWGILLFASGAFIAGLWPVLIGWLLWTAGEMGYRDLLLRSTLEGVQVGAIADRDVVRVAPDLSLAELAEQQVLGRNQRAFFVAATDDGDVLGLITLTDLRRVPQQDWPFVSVYRTMTPTERLTTIQAQADALQALQLMVVGGRDELPVFEGRRAIGIVTRESLLQAIEARQAVSPAAPRAWVPADTGRDRAPGDTAAA